jgi:hypothetical protein
MPEPTDANDGLQGSEAIPLTPEGDTDGTPPSQPNGAPPEKQTEEDNAVRAEVEKLREEKRKLQSERDKARSEAEKVRNEQLEKLTQLVTEQQKPTESNADYQKRLDAMADDIDARGGAAYVEHMANVLRDSEGHLTKEMERKIQDAIGPIIERNQQLEQMVQGYDPTFLAHKDEVTKIMKPVSEGGLGITDRDTAIRIAATYAPPKPSQPAIPPLAGTQVPGATSTRGTDSILQDTDKALLGAMVGEMSDVEKKAAADLIARRRRGR